jgi:hypothetical protein
MTKSGLLRRVMALAGLGLCAYGIYCTLHMALYIGTGQYWSNSWFYKANAALFGLIALRIGMSWVKDKRRS